MVKTLDTVQRWKGEPPAPKVTTHFVLTVPAGTPADAVIYIIGELQVRKCLSRTTNTANSCVGQLH